MLKLAPPHGWRAVWWELAIVTLGVLIALGAQQSVEALRWRQEVRETKNALRHPVEEAYAAMLSRQDMQGCVDRRLAEIGIILDRHDRGEKVGNVDQVGSPTSIRVQTYAFDMAIASQAFSHMSIAEQATFFEPIGSYRMFEEVVDDERAAWRRLRALNRAATLTPADWSEVREAFDRATSINATLSGGLRNSEWLSSFRGFKKPEADNFSLRDLPIVKQLCRS